MDIYRTLATLKQGHDESIDEYFERFNYYLGRCPDHGFQLHELMKFYLDGMSMGELRIMDTMAGGSIWDRTPTEVWYLIQDRAAETRPYTQYIYSQQSLEEKAHQLALARQAAAIAYYKAEFEAEIAELDNGLEEFTENKREQQSAPEPHEFSSEDEEVTVSIEERADEDIMDEDMQVVPMTSTEEVPPTEEISLQCSEIIIEQNTVITSNPIIPHISRLVLSFTVQNDTIKEALRNNQVWGLLEEVRTRIPMVRAPKIMLKSEKFLDSLCINWKTRKKDMRGSPEKIDIHMARARKRTQRLEQLPDGLHRTWKRRKKCKHIFLDNECSMFSVYMQKSRSTFGWKPGWSSWINVSHRVTKKSRRFWTVEDNSFHQHHCSILGIRKFDGVHLWAPNIR